MIFASGRVNHRCEAIISIHAGAPGGQALAIDAVIDTGFSGYLSLPASTIPSLSLPFVETRSYLLGNNRPVDFNLYSAVVLWNNQERDILVLESEAHPLVGMSLLKGSLIYIDAVDGGDVRIESRI